MEENYGCEDKAYEGISGTAVKNRDRFLKMIEDATLGKIDMVVTKEISRFSRNTVDSIKYTEYLLTRDGFSLLVMGFTGSRALEWKLKYIEAFNKMEQAIKNPYGHLSKEVQAIFALDHKQQQLEVEVKELKDGMPLFNVECKELQALVRKKGIEVLGGKGSQAYKNNSLRGKVYADIQHELKREFQVTRYEAIKRCQLIKAREIIADYKVPFMLKDEIIRVNNQINFKEVI